MNTSQFLLIHPRHTLGNQELLQSLGCIEPAPTTVLDSTVRQYSFVVNGHTVDVDSTAKYQLLPLLLRDRHIEE